MRNYLALSSNNQKNLMLQLQNGPITIGICGSSVDFQSYTGGIYNNEDCCNILPSDDIGFLDDYFDGVLTDHSVLLVGYGKNILRLYGIHPENKLVIACLFTYYCIYFIWVDRHYRQ